MNRRCAVLGLLSLAGVAAVACGTFDEAPPAAVTDAGAGGSEGSDATDGGAADDPVDGSLREDVNVPPADAAVDGPLRAFVTGTGYTDVTTAAIADNKCTAEANGRLSGKFVAWYPDKANGVSAPARLARGNGTPVDGPWYRVDGKRIVANREALSKTATVPLEAPITLGAAGTVVNGSVWTGTLADGGIGTVCPGGVNPTSGSVNQTNGAWTQQTFFTATCSSSLGLYCFQVE